MACLYLRFQFCRLIALSLLFLFSLSCTRMPSLFGLSLGGRTLDHNFEQGTADALYRQSDLIKRVFIPSPRSDSEGDPKDSGSTDRQNRNGKYSDLYEESDTKAGAVSVDDLLKIRTGPSKGQKGPVSFAQENIIIDSAISFINKYEFLDYKIISPKTKWQKNTAKLLGRVEKFKGFPDTEYYILPKEEGNYLVLYKVAPPDKIPYDELPLAKALGSLLAVPFVGYAVENCLAEVKPDKNNRETGQYRPRCEGIRRGDYILLKEKSKQLFQYEEKLDLFPRDFFSGQWFYHRTVVRAPGKRKVGHTLFDSAHLVEFHPDLGKLAVLDTSGYEIKEEDKIPALFIPVEWADYRIKRDSENLDGSFSEEMKAALYDTSLRYLKINFKELVENQIPGYSGKKKLKSVFITDNYFSFNMEIAKEGSGIYLLKYAFSKKTVDKSANSYIEKKWFEKDSTLFFPSFAEKRRYYDSSLAHTQEDKDKFLRTTRFDPRSKEIRWYFSKQTPHPDDKPELGWIRELGRQAVALLNRAFQEAAKCPSEEDRNRKCSNNSIKIILDESEDQEVGDIRYNILNLMFTEGKQTSGLLGFGPNVADPTTGKIISATANVWVNHILSIYIRIVRRYIRFQVYSPAWKFKPHSEGVTLFLHEKIQKLCPEVSLFIKENRNKRFDRKSPDLYDKERITTCAGQLSRSVVLGTILHEMLHGFANRHIFSASVDKENFYKSYDEIKFRFGSDIFIEATASHPHPPQYSSVMDYMSFHHPVLSVPGELDIATLRFIYFDQVELAKGGFLKVPSGVNKEDPDSSQKSILQAVKNAGLTREDLKSYKILCGGKKEPGEIDLDKPLCKRFDYGAGPLEIVTNIIAYSDNLLMAGRNRYDAKSVPSRSEIAFIERVAPFYKKWKKLRDALLKLKDNKSVFDYSFIDSGHIEKYEGIIKKEALENSDFQSYYEIQEPIFNYIINLIFLPLKHCIYKGSDNTYSAVALKDIKAELVSDFIAYPDDSAEFIDCKSPVVRQWQKDNEKGELVSEVGFFGKNRTYSLRPKRDEPYDELSVFAMFNSIMYSCEVLNDFFDVTADPVFADRYYQKMLDYVFSGMDLNPYIDMTKDPNIPRDSKGNPRLPRFLSYNVDATTDSGVPFLTVHEWRQWPLHMAVHLFKEHPGSQSVKQEMRFHFGAKRMDLAEIARFSEYIESRTGFYASDYPFFTEIYKRYESSFGTFAEFIREYSSILDIKEQGFYIPYTAAGFPARLFQRYNAFAKCLEEEKSGQKVCPDRDSKKAFLQSAFSKYYQGKVEISPFKFCQSGGQ